MEEEIRSHSSFLRRVSLGRSRCTRRLSTPHAPWEGSWAAASLTWPSRRSISSNATCRSALDLGSEPFHLLVFRDLFFLFEVFRLIFCCCYLFLVVWGRKGVWIFAFVGILIGFLVCLWCCVFRSCWMGRAFRFWSFRTCVLAWRLDFFDMQVCFGSRSRIVVSDRSSNISCLEVFFFFHTVYLIFSCSCWFMFVWS